MTKPKPKPPPESSIAATEGRMGVDLAKMAALQSPTPRSYAGALIGIALFILFAAILALAVCNRLMFLEERMMRADIGYLKETVETLRAETDARELDRISVEQLKEDVQTLRASAGLSGAYDREQLKKFDEDIARIFYILRSQRRPK